VKKRTLLAGMVLFLFVLPAIELIRFTTSSRTSHEDDIHS